MLLEITYDRAFKHGPCVLLGTRDVRSRRKEVSGSVDADVCFMIRLASNLAMSNMNNNDNINSSCSIQEIRSQRLYDQSPGLGIKKTKKSDIPAQAATARLGIFVLHEDIYIHRDDK